MEIDLNRDARDGDAERVAAPQSNRAVGVEVVAQEGNGDGGMVAAAEGVGAAPETVGVGASEGVAPEKNGVGSGGEKEVASEGSGAGAEVGAAVETNGVAVDVWICHQCRQRKTGLTAACRGSKKNGKCTLRYCKNCIRNRYPLIADEVLKEEAWECPKCRNDCNCSKCKKRRGEEPAGPMVHSVKRPKGNLRRIESTDALKDEIVIPRGTLVKRPKGNLRRIESTDALKDEIVIPRGTLVTCVAGVEMQPEDVGAAIQFLEFCRSFGEIFQIRKGQSEKIVKDITGDRQLREVSSVVAELHTNLLSVIENGNYKPLKYPKHGDTWIRKLSKYITDSTLHAKDFILDCLSHGLSGYKNLSPSHKLDVLNSLCDEALSSEKLRTRIEAREGVARQKIRAATEKEKELKERQNDMAKTMGGEITGNEEANNIFCQIKEAKEVKQAAMKELEELGCVLRSTPVMVDKGVAYWKLDGYCNNNTNILRQEFDKEATMKNQDKWFMFSEDEQKVVENHVTTRSQRPWRKDNRV
uniref:DDT domain-containing protein n=1 Tax=Triticum urartu TaxID=4572 RepID=A0A8R7UQ51_TRIUA